MRSLGLAVLLALSAIPASAQSAAGKWNVTAASQTGALSFVLDVAVKGDKVTGSVSNQFMPEFPLENMELKGNDLAFTLRTQLYTFRYKGRVSGDTLTLTHTVLEDRTAGVASQGPSLGAALRQAESMTAKRVK